MKRLEDLMSRDAAAQQISRGATVLALVLALLLGIGSTSRAQTPAAKRTILRAGRLLNVHTGELKANQAVVIEGDRIAQIAPSSEIKAGPGDTTIDLPEDRK